MLEGRCPWKRGKINHYLPAGKDPKSPDISPLYEKLTASLPPAYIMPAECDPLCDDGVMYHERLQEAGASSELKLMKGAIHSVLLLRELIQEPSVDPQAMVVQVLKDLGLT